MATPHNPRRSMRWWNCANPTSRFIFEHAGIFSPEDIERAAELGAGISAASIMFIIVGNAYSGPLGETRANWITPLASASRDGIPVTVNSDAPLAPPLPLMAAGVHMLGKPAKAKFSTLMLDAI